MSKHPTKLFLAGVAALALFALGITSILAPAGAAPPDKSTLGKLNCSTFGEIAKWVEGGEPGLASWECAPDDDALGGLTCDEGDIAKWTPVSGGDPVWTCGAVSEEGVVRGIQDQLDNMALLAFGQASAFAFVTSVPYTGALGGTSGANDKCNAHAAAAGLPGQYKAWLSVTAADSPAASFDRAIGRYITPLGSRIATSWAQLINGSIDNPLDVDEFGVAIAPAEVWSNTNPYAGNSLVDTVANPGFSCTGFTSDDETQRGTVGHTDQVDSTWTASVSPTAGFRFCDMSRRLYCFGQGFGTAFE